MAVLDILEKDLSTQHLQKLLGPKLRRLFEINGFTTADGPKRGGDEFMGDTLDSLYQSTASGANSVAAAIVTGATASPNGTILLDAGDANAGRSDLSYGLHYQSQLNAVMVARVKVNTLTTRKFEVGFTDVISGTDAGAVATKATPTFNADDCVVMVFDTNDDTEITLVGNKATVAATPADFGLVLVADTYYYIGVQLNGGSDSATGFVLDANGRLLKAKTITACVTTTVGLTPWLFVQNRAGNAGTMTVDYLRAYQRRTTSI